MMSSPNAVEKLPDSKHLPMTDSMIKTLSSVKAFFKIAWPYFLLHSHLFSAISYLLSLSLFYINGLALFTQQHAICSRARWSDLGGMLRGLTENMNISLHGVYCTGEQERQCAHMQACLCSRIHVSVCVG